MFTVLSLMLFFYCSLNFSSSGLPPLSYLQKVRMNTQQAFGGYIEYEEYKEKNVRSFFAHRIEQARAAAAQIVLQATSKPKKAKLINLKHISKLAQPKVDLSEVTLPAIISRAMPAKDLDELFERLSVPRHITVQSKCEFQRK